MDKRISSNSAIKLYIVIIWHGTKRQLCFIFRNFFQKKIKRVIVELKQSGLSINETRMS
jgi:hypothetical protein